jgi:hypothetical protein
MNRHVLAPVLLACAVMLAPAHALADPRGIAEPPEPLTPEAAAAQRVKQAADMKAWLPRLVGRFSVEGIADFNGTGSKQAVSGGQQTDSSSLEGGEQAAAATDEGKPIDPFKQKGAGGRADCVAIGKGPGVHCLINVTWVPEWTPQGDPVDGGEPFLAPAMKLFGLDTNTPLIIQLQLDTDGVAELETTTLKGSTVRWIYETRCESDTHADARCRRVTRFYSPVGNSRIQLTIEFEKWNQSQSDWLPVSTFNLDMRRETDEQPGGAPPGISGIR